MNKLLVDLIKLCRYAGKHPDYVQGGGGNCSIKTSDKIAIKASGYFLEEVSLKNGFVLLDRKTLKPVLNNHLRPSLETYIHLLLGKYIIHTHPIVVGALVCTKGGEKTLKKIFKEKNYYWVNYASPGKDLSCKIKKLMASKKINKDSQMALFLENHGIFVSSSTIKGCIDLHEKIINKLKSYFKITNNNHKIKKSNYIIKGFLTPDQIVYSTIKPKKLSKKNKVAINETNVFLHKVIRLIKSKDWKVKYLSNANCKFIMNMEEEKYRQKVK